MVRRNNNNRLLSRIMTVRRRKMCRNLKMMLRTRRRTSLNLSRKRSRIARRRTIQTMRGQRLRQMYMAVVLRTPNSSAYCIKVGQLPGHRLTGNNRCSNRRICRTCGWSMSWRTPRSTFWTSCAVICRARTAMRRKKRCERLSRSDHRNPTILSLRISPSCQASASSWKTSMSRIRQSAS